MKPFSSCKVDRLLSDNSISILIQNLAKICERMYLCGFSGIDLDVYSWQFNNYKATVIKDYFRTKGYRLTDWNFDDPFGFGVGKNMNNAQCNGWTIDWKN